jgi:hypothetical protein
MKNRRKKEKKTKKKKHTKSHLISKKHGGGTDNKGIEQCARTGIAMPTPDVLVKT